MKKFCLLLVLFIVGCAEPRPQAENPYYKYPVGSKVTYMNKACTVQYHGPADCKLRYVDDTGKIQDIYVKYWDLEQNAK